MCFCMGAYVPVWSVHAHVCVSLEKPEVSFGCCGLRSCQLVFCDNIVLWDLGSLISLAGH